MTLRKCSQCQQEKTEENFRPGKKSAKCKACHKVEDAEYYRVNKDKWREREKRKREEDLEGFLKQSREAQARYRNSPTNTIHLRYLKSRYGVDDKWYAERFDEQNGCCAICGNRAPLDKRLHVDHDHETGQVRQLLCFNCNRGLGSFHDSPEKLLNAIKYLQKHKG